MQTFCLGTGTDPSLSNSAFSIIGRYVVYIFLSPTTVAYCVPLLIQFTCGIANISSLIIMDFDFGAKLSFGEKLSAIPALIKVGE